jgi:hypothetical protein
VAARAGVNTINAFAGGGVAAIMYSKYHSKGKFIRPADVVNGILGALVASSPTCAAVHTYDSLIIGAIGALLACWVNDTVTKKWIQLDDPVGALGVHVGGGLWGIIAVALFGDGSLPGVGLVASGLFRGGGFELMWIQLLGMLAIMTWSVVTMCPFFYMVGVGVGLSRDLRDPRSGLRHDVDQLDPILHGCSEDPTEKITAEISKAIEREHSMARLPAARQLLGENAFQEQSNDEASSNTSSQVTRRAVIDSDTNDPDETIVEVQVEPGREKGSDDELSL